jgi:cell wall-associated NlpC family hydrolase
MGKIRSDKILRTAKKWVGTRFHHNGRIIRNGENLGGVDCIGLAMAVGKTVGSTCNGKNIASYDYLTYSRYPNQGEMKDFLDRRFVKIDEKEAKIGDLIYFNFDNRLEHIAIISDAGIMHCCVEARRVVEHALDDYWRRKIRGYYRYPKN